MTVKTWLLGGAAIPVETPSPALWRPDDGDAGRRRGTPDPGDARGRRGPETGSRACEPLSRKGVDPSGRRTRSRVARDPGFSGPLEDAEDDDRDVVVAAAVVRERDEPPGRELEVARLDDRQDLGVVDEV